jgi:uncharacterized membrane protein
LTEKLLPGLEHAPNVHPAFVHFPIAFWFAALLFWLLSSILGRRDLFHMGRWLLYLAAVSSVIAAGTGLSAEESLGHDSPHHDLVHLHKTLMFVASALGLAIALVAWALRTRDGRAIRWGLTASLAVLCAFMTIGADRGGELVYRYGVGTVCPETPPEHGSALMD